MVMDNIPLFKKTLSELVDNRDSFVYTDMAKNMKFKVGRKSQFKKWIIPLYLEILYISDFMCDLVSIKNDSYIGLDIAYNRMHSRFSVNIYKMDSGSPAYRVSIDSIRQQFKINDLAGFKDDYVRYRQSSDKAKSILVLLPGDLVDILGFIEDYFNLHKKILIETFDLEVRYKKNDSLNEQILLSMTSIFKSRVEINNRFPSESWSEHYDELITSIKKVKVELKERVLLNIEGSVSSVGVGLKRL